MQFNFRFKKLILIISFIFFINNFAFSQTSSDYNLIISWEALNFVPVDFKGKILPSPGSTVIVAIEFLQNNKIVDLSKEKIYWYINGELVSNTLGNKQISFYAPDNNIVDVRVDLPKFDITKTIEIPIIEPKLVIKAPFPNKEVNINNFELDAMPYFFNLESSDLETLDFQWSINSEPATPYNNDPSKINIEIKGDQPLNLLVEVVAKNIKNQFEFAEDRINLNFKK